MTNAAFAPLLTAVYSVKRASGSGGQTGAPATLLSGLKGTPLFPVSAETQQRIQLDSPYRAREVYLIGLPALREGDYLSDGTLEYRIKAFSPWVFQGLSATLVVAEMQVRAP